MQIRLRSLDWYLITCFLAIVLTGLITQYSAAGGSFKPWTKHQIYIFILSAPIFIATVCTDLSKICKHSYTLFYLTIILLVSVEFLGVTTMGANRWIRLGSFSIQPSELAKITLILSLAKCLQALPQKQRLIDFVLPFTLFLIPSTLTLIQPSLGSAIIMALITLSMLFIAGIEKKHLLFGLASCAAILPLGWRFYLYDYHKLRILSFLNPETDPFGIGYSVVQSKIAIGSGGLTGKGLLNGSQTQLGFLPEKHTDFIFSVFAEEHGFISSTILLLLYTFLSIKSLLIAWQATNMFEKLVATGISTLFASHLVINTGMVMGLFPVIGIPLPILSYGGSVALTSLVCFGLLLNIGMKNKEKLAIDPT